LEYIRSVFIPTVESNRQLPGCSGKPAIRFSDNWLCHCSDETLRELALDRVLVITYPPHSSQIFQVLDVLLFGRLKAAKKYFIRDAAVSPQLDHVMRAFRPHEQATTSSTVRESWEKAGLRFTQRAEHITDRSMRRKSAEFPSSPKFGRSMTSKPHSPPVDRSTGGDGRMKRCFNSDNQLEHSAFQFAILRI
jgi:hypothetical protein